MKFIYQIGNVPLFGALQNDVSLNEKRSWIVQQTKFQQTGGQFTHTPRDRRIPDSAPISIEGTLTTTSHQHFLFTSSRLRAIGGFANVPLIVFETYNNKTIRWLYTMGSITDVDESSQYGESDGGFYLRDISIQMVVDPSWRPLLAPYWESRQVTEYKHFPTTQAGVDNLFIHPQLVDTVYEQKERGFYFQKWDSSLSALSPMMWPHLYTGNGYGEDYAAFRSVYVMASEFAWPGQSNAIYAFTGLDQTGTLTLQVNDFTATLDLADTNTALIARGLAGLQKSDEIFVGNTTPYNSFIRRSSGVISNFVPRWTDNNVYPGALNPGLNHVTFSGNGTVGKAAMNIEFGAL